MITSHTVMYIKIELIIQRNKTLNYLIPYNHYLLNRKGRLILSYEIISSLHDKNDSELITLTKRIYTAATEWKGKILNGTVDKNRTRSFNLKRSK